MKKQLLTTLIAACIVVMGMAQAVLPTSWGFTTTTLPSGWTSTGTFTYYTTSAAPASGPTAKFSATGEMLTIHVASTPGTLSFDIAANTTGTWSGDFEVQESPDSITFTTVGTAYTALANFGAATNTYYAKTGIALNSASRYVRFNFVNKVSGSNVGIDNVSITAGVSTAAEIAVQQASTTIVNGGTYTLASPVSTLLGTTFTIQNLGTVGTLSVTAATLSGPAASDFAVTTAMPLNVTASSTGNLVVNFTPSASGTRNAVLTLTSNDATNNPYIINLNGIGGNLATEPTAQATNLTFPISKSYHIQGTYTAASPAPDGYLVLRKTGSAVTDAPVDGVVYQRGDMVGASKVVYSANLTGFFPNEIVANTTYYFSVFAYNGVGQYRNYLTTSPLTGNVASSGNMQPASYYNSINTANSTFVTDLHTLTNPHTALYYSDYGPKFAATFYTRDTVANQRVITCVYSGENKVYTEPFDWTADNFSREHSYPQSWMPTVNDPNYTNDPEYEDYHMLTPVDQTNCNAIRSNYPYGVVVGTPTFTYLGAKLGLDANGHKVWEPRDADKGDAARCMLYQCIAYTGVAYSGPANTTTTYGGTPVAGTNIWSLPSSCYNPGVLYAQDQDVLKQWSYNDPPDNFEIARNDYVDSLQGNRNPFIDHPEYICYIDFSTMTYMSTPSSPCAVVGVNEIDNTVNSAVVYPNPASSSFTVLVDGNNNAPATVSITNVMGQQVASFSNLENNNGMINCSGLTIANGLYLVKVIEGDKIFVSRLLVNK